MDVNKRLARPANHFELKYYFVISQWFINNFYCIKYKQK